MRQTVNRDSRRVLVEDQWFDLIVTMDDVGSVLTLQLIGGGNDLMTKDLLTAAAKALLKHVMLGAMNGLSPRDIAERTACADQPFMTAIADMQDAVLAAKLSTYGRRVQ
ncbi:hypothetical protein [Asticcacaulis sp. YBE204]|uniref:hypothetical protein n=1 Tax=Asticcacaulis sp. YBE204 TaxID=1282363 RepID=UPI0003C3CF6E|nr:hypothetical protein [Asticcacaulis sp. YBE204]ESQ78479.1 hypothetical protein AEYBE204_13065 [Asticcacaulis sp. YBE204]